MTEIHEDRMRLKRHLVVFLFMGPALGSAKPLGSPVDVRGRKQLTIALNTSYQAFRPGNQSAVVQKVFLKTGWGITRWLDVYGFFGNTRLEMKNFRSDLNDTRDKFRFAYGLGFCATHRLGRPAVRAKSKSKTRSAARTMPEYWLCGGVYAMRYPAEGVYNQSVNYIGSSFVKQNVLRYDTREFAAFAGIYVPYRFLRVYAGGVGWLQQRVDKKQQYIQNLSEQPLKIGEKTQTYQSGLWTGGVLGVQVNLPQNVSITLETVAFNRQNYQISVGVCQTGIRAW